MKGRGLFLTVVALCGFSGFLATPAGAGPSTCRGERATIVGTDGPDQLSGGPRRDVISGGAGNDRLEAVGPRDLICGGAGSDRLVGDLFNDTLVGGPGTDRLVSGRGRDSLTGGPGDDRLDGGKGDDRLRGGGGSDHLDASHGDDVALGEAGGRDTVIGGWGFDEVGGGAGSRDLVWGDPGGDDMDGGPGRHDIVTFANSAVSGKGVDVNLELGRSRPYYPGPDDKLAGFEDAIGTPFQDVLVGDAGPNWLDGGGGNDALQGQSYTCSRPFCPDEPPHSIVGDRAFGGSGVDWCLYFARADSCESTDPDRGPTDPDYGKPLQDTTAVELSEGLAGSTLGIEGLGGGLNPVTGEREPADQTVNLRYSAGAYWISDPGGVKVRDGCAAVTETSARCPSKPLRHPVSVQLDAGDDTLRVTGGIRVLAEGGEGDDRLFGGRAIDILSGGLGFDLLDGGKGDDVLQANSEADRLRGRSGDDLMIAFSICVPHTLDGGGGHDVSSFIRLRGPVRAKLRGRAIDPAVTGCAPIRLRRDEVLEGTNADDVLIGNAGNNGFLGRGGADVFRGLAGRDSINAQDGERDRLISCGSGRDTARIDRADPRPQSC